MVSRIGLGIALVSLLLLAPGSGRGDQPSAEVRGKQLLLRVGAVAYAPSSVTVFEGIKHYFEKNHFPVDYVLYSNYDALVKALHDGQVDIAWNTPLAHAQFHLLSGGKSQTLAMRDVDCNYRCKLLVRKDADISALEDLKGKTLVLGSRHAAEATVLPVYFLKKEGVPFKELKVLRLDKEVDLRGNPCASPIHVLKALAQGRADAGVIGEQLWKELSERQAPEVANLKVIWTSPPFSHCVFTAGKDFDQKLGKQFTKLMLAMDRQDPLTAQVMELEGTRKWLPGSPEGFEDLLKALREEKRLAASQEE